MSHAARSILLLLLTVCGAACEKTSAAGAGSRATTAQTTAVAAPPLPQRIVSLAPSVTETLFALGVGDRVVAVTRFCDYPAEAAQLPKVGGLTDVDVEMVLSLEPDLVVGVSSKTGSALEQTLDKADVEVLFLPVESFADVQFSMRELGNRVGASERAAELAEAIAAIDVEPASDAPEVLVLFGRKPWVGAGPETFADEMVRRAGAKNVLADLDTQYPTLDDERIAVLTPKLIIDTSWADDEKPKPLPKSMVKEATVLRLDPALIRPGPRLADAMTLFRRAVIEASKPAEAAAAE